MRFYYLIRLPFFYVFEKTEIKGVFFLSLSENNSHFYTKMTQYSRTAQNIFLKVSNKISFEA